VTAKNISVRMPQNLMALVNEWARHAEVPQSTAIRLLCVRALGGNVAHSLADERVAIANRVLTERFRLVFDNLRTELHAALDEAIGGTAKPPPEPEEVEEEPEAEPELVPVRGRRAAKARRR